MLTIGCHLSSSDGFLNMGKTALSIGADTFAFFTRNPRGGSAKRIDPDDTAALIAFMNTNSFGKLVAHAPYTLNPCSPDEKVREFAHMAFSDDLSRMEYIPGNYYNFHPGSYVSLTAKEGIKLTAQLLNNILSTSQSTTVLIETMSGKGSEIGRSFEEIAEIISSVSLNSHIGVCFDTCHVYDAGYDIKNDLDGVLEQFDRIIGVDRLKAIHLNDSMNPFSSHKDRHQKIGKGSLGIETLSRVTNHPVLRNKPFILETPNGLDGYAKEISVLRSMFYKDAVFDTK